MIRTLITLSLVATGCGAADPMDQGPDAGAPSDGMTGDIDAAGEPDAIPEPTPTFTIDAYTSGSLAITEAGLEPTFRIDGTAYWSYLRLGLRAAGADESCAVLLRPAFAGLGSRSASNRVFATITLDIGASTILSDECGWDDAYMLSQFAGFGDGTVVVGFTMARFAEDRPYLDIYHNRSWPLPNNTASIVVAGGGQGFSMDAEGAVDTATLVQPTSGMFVDGLYEW